MMNQSNTESYFDSRVAAMRLPTPRYPEPSETETALGLALERASRELGWFEENRGLFGKLIPRGARVLIKPNLVRHENEGPWGMEPLVTHQALIHATVEAALRAEPAEVVVGDAPLQGCDFERLLNAMGLDAWAEALMKREPRFKGVRDFRRTTSVDVNGVRVRSENRQSEEKFVLFDLGRDSLLEPITDDRETFRVTCYDPRMMARTHAPGRHQYLIAKDVIDADVVINLPKLKTHKKAGITCALKNLIGINGNKEYLPHHRIGGSQSGGDCYPGRSRVKQALEHVSDRQNMTTSLTAGRLWRGAARPLQRVLHLMGDPLGIEGSWSGNDTIWRTCLDLNRILIYGRSDASMADTPQRRVIHLVDAVVAGQGDGPLAPQPLPMGLILAGQNAAAVDWVGAHLLGYDARRIPISRYAFGKFKWPLVSFAHREVALAGDLGTGVAEELIPLQTSLPHVIYPAGWRDAAHSTTAPFNSQAEGTADVPSEFPETLG